MEQYWYCGVALKGTNAVYPYISDAGELPVGAYVEVPLCEGCGRTVGVVRSCAAYSAEDAPYPVEKTAHILRLAAQEAYDEQPALAPFWLYDRDEEGEVEYALGIADYYLATENWEAAFAWACANHGSADETTAQKVIECYERCRKNGVPSGCSDA